MNIVYLIGNGFDLNLGMKTSYRDFCVDYTELPSTDNDAAVVKKIKRDIWEDIESWSEFELKLGDYLDDNMDSQDAVILHEHFIDCLQKYLETEERKHVIDKSYRKMFLEYLCTPNRLLSADKEELDAYTKHMVGRLDIKIITFNYTRSVERIFGNDNNKPIRNKTPSIELEHIHGFTNERLILGVNDTSQIKSTSLSTNEDVIISYVKTNNIQTYKLNIEAKCQQWILDANLICLFGLSFGYSDKNWWELVTQRLQKECKAIVFEYNETKLGGSSGAARMRAENMAKERLLSKTTYYDDPINKEQIKKNIYVAVNSDMFKFSRDNVPKTFWRRVIKSGGIIAILFCLIVVPLFVWSTYHKKNDNSNANVDNIAAESTFISNPVPILPTPIDTPSKKVASESRSLQNISTHTQGVSVLRNQDESYQQAYLKEDVDIDQAIKDYNTNTKAFPKDPRNFVRLGMIYSKKGETLALAAVNFNKAVMLVDNDVDVWQQLALVSGRLGKADMELAAYKRYSALKPQDLTVTRRIGELLMDKKQYSEAITNLEMFLTTNDKDVKTLIMLADAYEATNRPQKTAELLAKAKGLKGDAPDVRERLYRIYKKDGKMDLAETEIRELVNLTKDNKYRLMFCDDLVEAGKLDEAAKVANDLKKSDPTNRDGLMVIAGIQKRQKRYDDAVETYKLVLFTDNNYAPACVGRADAHLLLGEYERAETYYKKALLLDPKIVAAELGLSRVYKATKQKDLQMQHLNRAKALDPNNKMVLDEFRQ